MSDVDLVGDAHRGDAVLGEDGVARCPWAARPGPMRDYHDTEWGVPVAGRGVDRETAYFERLTLEAFQSGLSWSTILAKRPAFREAFAGFDVARVAAYGDEERAALLADARIVRNRAKVDATIVNAGAVLAMREEGPEVFADLLESFRPEEPPAPRVVAEVPTTSPGSLALSKALKKRGLTFVGPTTMHALMEATGLVDTHLVACHRRGVGRAGSR
ncbi:DNA-3-methyladenine glycosylase I [Nocardioides zeae]|uniref:DNA-3-methyladenine glycosylase I n=1 Tax=Nocardioides zeae TaxID=1457234 RepID=A0ACC6ILX4_9ACTN|nr:DNA-3-methyladenine glycosylase I [Nocardioides zeae]MDR6175069.1 DNA-3-methyladenine glycosylase I [Nocardioides zeae]MDR6211647.1 DNA-3-methyladenine glycosylase I [Nocardioides zeae]